MTTFLIDRTKEQRWKNCITYSSLTYIQIFYGKKWINSVKRELKQCCAIFIIIWANPRWVNPLTKIEILRWWFLFLPGQQPLNLTFRGKKPFQKISIHFWMAARQSCLKFCAHLVQFSCNLLFAWTGLTFQRISLNRVSTY